MTIPIIKRSGAIEAWIIDDTGFPKKGRHSVGVARQYCGQLGKQDNCQVAVSLSLAHHVASLPIAWPLYLPMEVGKWLLMEWPEGDAEPTKYWLATFLPDMPFDRLVDLANPRIKSGGRWRIERFYQELKQELGLGHGWRGSHHHAPLYIAAYAFLISERARLSSSVAGAVADQCATPSISQNCKSRGAACPPRTTYRQLDRNDAPTSDRRPRNHPGAMFMLLRTAQSHRHPSISMMR